MVEDRKQNRDHWFRVNCRYFVLAAGFLATIGSLETFTMLIVKIVKNHVVVRRRRLERRA
jgi:hypothetical protein